MQSLRKRYGPEDHLAGLRQRPTYNEVIDYLENDQPIIKYPNRAASFIRNSPYLSQFDGDSWIDLEEQENNITKEQMKEMQVKKVAAETQTTAQLLRSSRNRMRVFGASSGTQTDTVDRRSNDTQTEAMQTRSQNSQTPQPPRMTDAQSQINMNESKANAKSTGTQTGNPLLFDMTIDPVMDETMHDLEIAAAAQAEEIDLRHKKIKRLVGRHLGNVEREDVVHQQASSSSSSRVPMIVNKEGDQQKREAPESSVEPKGRRGRPASVQPQPMSLDPELVVEPKRRGRTRSPAKAKAKAAIEAPPQPKAEPKAKPEPKAIPKPKPNSLHGVDLIESKDRKFWEKQNMTVLKQQAELRGYRFSDAETKGGQKVSKGVIQTVKKYKKTDYFEVLMKLLKI